MNFADLVSPQEMQAAREWTSSILVYARRGGNV